MAINIPILTEFDSKGLQSAQGAFNNFKSKVGEAEGAMGKFKAGGTAALDAIKANAGMLAAAAGAAIAGFVIKAIGDFQKLALEVDKFSNSSGLAAEQASRWVEVASDIGVESNTLITAFNKLNKAAADNSDAFRRLGIDISTTASGATDVNKTFLDTVEALRKVEDPAKRAKLATELLGKSWTEVSELIEMGSQELETALAGVSDQKIIDEEEIRKAKEMRAAQDALGDAFQEAALTLGEALIPALTATLKAITPVLEAMKLMGGTLQTGLNETITKFLAMGKSMSDIARELGADNEQSFTYMAKVLGITLDDLYAQLDRDLIPTTYLMERAWKEGYRAMIPVTEETETMTDAVTLLDQAWSDLLGEVDKREAWRNLQEELQQADDKIAEVFAQNTPEAMAIAAAAIDDQIVAIAKYVDFMESEIPDFIETKILAALDNGQIEEARRLLELKIGEPIYVDVIPNPLLPGGPRAAFMEEGDRVSNPRPRIPGGQAKPGVDNPLTQARRDLEAGLLAIGGQRQRDTVIVNVQGSVISSEDLIEKIRKGLVDSQRNGNQLVYTNK